MKGIASLPDGGPRKGCKMFGPDELELKNPLTCLLRSFTLLCKQYVGNIWMAILAKELGLGQDNLGKGRAV